MSKQQLHSHSFDCTGAPLAMLISLTLGPNAVNRTTVDIPEASITATSATINWLEPSGQFSNYVLEIVPGISGFPLNMSRSTLPKLLTGLAPGTDYNVTIKTRVISSLGVDVESAPTQQVFTTSEYNCRCCWCCAPPIMY